MNMLPSSPERREGQADQALGLRELVAKRGDPLLEEGGRRMPAPRLVAEGAARVITIISGKGGVGKTNVVVNLAMCLAAKGKKVLIFDADLSLANVDVLLDLKPRYTLEDVISGERAMADVLMPVGERIRVIPAGSGSEALANITREHLDQLLAGLESLSDDADYLLVDTAAGVHDSVLRFAEAADETLVVTTAEPTANLDAYSTIKMLVRRNPDVNLGLLVNMARDRREAAEALRTVMLVTRQFMRVEICNRGYILRDANVLSAVRRQQPVVAYSPHCSASKCFLQLADQFLESGPPRRSSGGLRRFLERLAGTMRSRGKKD